MKKIVYYVNQFYGQIGGEEAADQTPIVKEGSVGPATFAGTMFINTEDGYAAFPPGTYTPTL